MDSVCSFIDFSNVYTVHVPDVFGMSFYSKRKLMLILISGKLNRVMEITSKVWVVPLKHI